MKRWPVRPLGEFIEERTERLGGRAATIYSVTNDNGFVRSLELFDKQVFSADTSNYKCVGFHDIAYNPSRINVGSVAMLGDMDGGAVSPMYVIVRCKPDLLPRYLLYFLKSDPGLRQIRHRCEGAVRFQLKFRDLSAIPMLMPPLAEQERIVKLLDEADRLRKLRFQADRRSADLIPALFNEMFGDPIGNSKGWQMVNIEQACIRVTDGTHDTPAYVQDGVPLVTSKNLRSGIIDFSNVQYISQENHQDIIKRSHAECGDILLAMIGTIGNAAIVPRGVEFSIKNVALFKPNRTMMATEYLYAFLSNTSFIAQLVGSAKGIVQKFVGLGMLRSITVPLPPLYLQKEFAQRVAEIRKVESVQLASRKRVDDLFQSMLHRAFEGEL